MQLESAFKAIDRDGSDAIDRAEMKQVSALWSELTDPPRISQLCAVCQVLERFIVKLPHADFENL